MDEELGDSYHHFHYSGFAKRCGLDRCYTAREVFMWTGLASVVTMVSLFMIVEFGWVLTVWVLGGLYFALLMGPLFRPTALSALFWTIIVFLCAVFWFRAYLTECRHQWKLQYLEYFNTFDEHAVAGIEGNNTSVTAGELKAEAKNALHAILEEQHRIQLQREEQLRQQQQQQPHEEQQRPNSSDVYSSSLFPGLSNRSGFPEPSGLGGLANASDLHRLADLYNSSHSSAWSNGSLAPPPAPMPTMDPLELSHAVVAAAEAARMAAELEADEDEQDFGGTVNNEDLKEYCLAQNDTEKPVRFYPMGEPNRVPDNVKHMLRATCPVWTCTYTQQSRSGSWYLKMMALVAVMLNVAHSCFACPTKACKCCYVVNDAFGCGRFRLWWIWIWVYSVPMFAVTYATFVKGFSFTDLYLLLPRIIEQALDDTEKSLMIIVIGLGFAVLWLLRNRIRQLLGVDDRNLIHVEGTRTKGFQVCIWAVVANQRDFPKADAPWTLHPRRESSLNCVPIPLFQGAERNLLPSQGKTCNMFCRLAYGDNEPQASRIVRMTQILRADTVVPFKESFCMEMEDDAESDTLLHIEVRDQALVGAQELGRVTLRVTELLDELERSKKVCEELQYNPEEGFDVITTDMLREYESGELAPDMVAKRAHYPHMMYEPEEEASPLLGCCGPSSFQAAPENGSRLGEAETQVLWMMTSDSRRDVRGVKETLKKVGFRPHRLSKGGAVWLAFAWLDE